MYPPMARSLSHASVDGSGYEDVARIGHPHPPHGANMERPPASHYSERRTYNLMQNALDRATPATIYRAYLDVGGNVWRLAVPFGKGWRVFSEGHVSTLATQAAYDLYDFKTQRDLKVKAVEHTIGDGSVLALRCCSGRDDVSRHYVAHALDHLQHLARSHQAATRLAPSQKRARANISVGPYFDDVSPVAYWYRAGHFRNEDEARGAFKLAHQQALDGMGKTQREWMGLTEAEFDAWMREGALPPLPR